MEEECEESGDFIILTKEDPSISINESPNQLENILSPIISLDDSCKEAMVTIKEVLKENNTMKGVLQKNNNEMKKQCEEIRKWKDEVTRDYNIQREALDKYKSFIQLLEKDKYEAEEKCKALQEEVKSLLGETKEMIVMKTELILNLDKKEKIIKEVEEKCNLLSGELDQLRCENDKTKHNNCRLVESNEILLNQHRKSQQYIEDFVINVKRLEMKNQELEMDIRHKKNGCFELRRKVAELSIGLTNAHQQLEEQAKANKNLETEKKALVQQLEDLTARKDERSYVDVASELSNNDIKSNASVDTSSQTEENLCNDCAAKEERILQLEMQLSEAYSAVNTLEQNIMESKKNGGTDLEISLPPLETTKVFSPEQTLDFTSREVNTSVTEPQGEGKKKIRCKIENLLPVFKERLDSMVKQDKIFIAQLEKEIDSLRKENQELQFAKSIERQKLQRLRVKYADLVMQNSEDSTKTSNASSEDEIKQLRYTVDQLTAELLQIKFSHEDNEIQKHDLKIKLDKLTEQAEAASVHKIQAECFAADYATEHDLRLKSEEELKKLRREHHELKEQLEYRTRLCSLTT